MIKNKPTSGRLKNLNPVFHKKTQAEDSSALSVNILKQAKSSGKLNLSSRNLATVPPELLSLGEAHSEDNNVDLNDGSGKWWEMEPLSHLDLSSNCISCLPENINQLDSLTTLILHDNNLTSVPAQLSHLFKLTKLDLAHNKITNLPIELSSLKELRWLNIAMNNLLIIPDCVYDFYMLQHLDMSHNKISKLDSGLGFLVRLTHLNLSHNQLKSVPPDLSNCKALIDLDLSYNSLTTDGLPPLGDLHNLQILQLTTNKLTLLPSLNGCSSLKEIHIGYNQMKEITVEELSTLSHLQVIVVRDNQIEKIPREMSCMQNLIRLDLTNNNLTELPATLGLLPHLKNLMVEGNSLRAIRRDLISGGTQRLLKHLKETMPLSEEDLELVKSLPCQSSTELPDRFTMRSSKAVNLACRDLCNIPDSVFDEALEVPCTIVDLSKNKLTQLPERLWCLSKTLTDLNLSHNKITVLPEAIKECLNLAFLNMETNQLSTLPSGLENCQRLREINLACNRFEEIPLCLYSIPGLEILIARDNKINVLNVDGLRKIKHLATLELRNNNIRNVPPQLGLMTQIRCLSLDGNGLKAPGPALLAKGTDTVLSWLRDKIPA